MQSTTTYSEPFNGARSKLTRIGTVTTTETVEHRISYETASWYTLVDVPAGTYDVVLVEDGSATRWVMVRYEGAITKEHFVNRLFTASSVHEPTTNIGKTRSCGAQLYPYIAAEAFATNPEFELAEDWSITSEPREFPDGRPYTSYALVRPTGEPVR